MQDEVAEMESMPNCFKKLLKGFLFDKYIVLTLNHI